MFVAWCNSHFITNFWFTIWRRLPLLCCKTGSQFYLMCYTVFVPRFLCIAVACTRFSVHDAYVHNRVLLYRARDGGGIVSELLRKREF